MEDLHTYQCHRSLVWSPWLLSYACLTIEGIFEPVGIPSLFVAFKRLAMFMPMCIMERSHKTSFSNRFELLRDEQVVVYYQLNRMADYSANY